jgi:hypothetical protein
LVPVLSFEVALAVDVPYLARQEFLGLVSLLLREVEILHNVRQISQSHAGLVMDPHLCVLSALFAVSFAVIEEFGLMAKNLDTESFGW